jgi:hypothetical protein
VNPASPYYKAGEVASVAIGAGRLVYAVSAKALSRAGFEAVSRGADVYATAGFMNGGRNALRLMLRIGIPGSDKSYVFLREEMRRPAIQIIRSAGRTSEGFTSWGAFAFGYGAADCSISGHCHP